MALAKGGLAATYSVVTHSAALKMRVAATEVRTLALLAQADGAGLPTVKDRGPNA